MPDLLDRLVGKIDFGSDCWVWTGALRSRYGRATSAAGKNTTAHRVVWEAVVGPIPLGLELDHLCRNRKCVNPDHLEPVTHRTNSLRSPYFLERSQRTHCPKGHPYDEANTIIVRKTERGCRECRRQANRKWIAKNTGGVDG